MLNYIYIYIYIIKKLSQLRIIQKDPFFLTMKTKNLKIFLKQKDDISNIDLSTEDADQNITTIIQSMVKFAL